MEQVILTNMCMVYDGDRILVENKVTGRYTGIVFPGGHVEAGEPLAEAIIREVLSEIQTLSTQSAANMEEISENAESVKVKYAVLLPPSILSNGMVAVSVCFFATSSNPCHAASSIGVSKHSARPRAT